MAEFVHLHVHSHYSILDGMSKVPDLVDKCMRTGMRAMALTDHGNMFGIKDLKDYVKKVNGAPKKKVKECEENIEKETDPAKKAELEAELVKLKEKAEASCRSSLSSVRRLTALVVRCMTRIRR